MGISKFDKNAFTYDLKPMHVERAKAVADAIKDSIKINKDWHIADFGCGTGLLGFNFIEDVKQITMIDVSQNMLDILKGKIESLNIKNMKILKLDIFNTDNLPIERFDLIVSLMTFHHIQDIRLGLIKLKSMLKSDGFLALADLYEEDGSYHQDGDTVHNGINQEELKQFASEIGLRFITSNTPYVIKKTIDNTQREYPVFLHIYQK